MNTKKKYDLVEWISSQNIRWFLHLVFWLAVLAFYTIFFGNINSNYKITFSFVIILLPVTIITTYFLNYELIPNYLFKKRYAKFFLFFIYTLIVSFYIEVGTIMVIFATVAELDMSEMHPSNTNPILLIAVMYVVVFLGVAVKLVNQNTNNQYEIQKLKGEKVEAELKFLKTQLHPHFLFNTLNNLYALTLEKSDKASDVVLKLSELLDYVLYDCDVEQVPIEKEIKQIENFIELERLRFGNRLEVVFSHNQCSPNLLIPPMLLMTLVENSFKHGVSKTMEKSWINIDLYTNQDKLVINVKNSKHIVKKSTNEISRGIGLHNLRNRLDLIYKDRYTFEVDEGELSYGIKLVIKNYSKS